MNKDWVSVVEKYAFHNDMNVDRAHQLAILIWFSANVGPIEGFEVGKYSVFHLALEGKKPYKGRWAFQSFL